MMIAITGALLNVVLDIMLVYGVEGIIAPMHIEGAAYASVISQIVMAGIAAYLLLKKTSISLKVQLPFNKEIKRMMGMISNLFIRTIAIARLMMPKSYVRLSAGREAMNEQMQAMCFLAGANSIFYGCKLLTTSNPETHEDVTLFRKLGINSAQTRDYSDEAHEAALLEKIEDDYSGEKTDNLFYDASIKKAEAVLG
jgi:hypothetical protein